MLLEKVETVSKSVDTGSYPVGYVNFCLDLFRYQVEDGAFYLSTEPATW